MEKTIYTTDFVDYGISDAFDDFEEAKKFSLKHYLEWTKEHNQRFLEGNGWGKEITADIMYEDIMQLLNDGYIEDYVYINTINYHTN